jgi:hypothetical protein
LQNLNPPNTITTKPDRHEHQEDRHGLRQVSPLTPLR